MHLLMLAAASADASPEAEAIPEKVQAVHILLAMILKHSHLDTSLVEVLQGRQASLS